MLRICYSEMGEARRWRLCGQLAGAWVDELRSCWQSGHKVAPGSKSIVDLSEVTFIDENGERLLSEMRSAGMKFVAVGVETKHLLNNLRVNGRKPLRRVIGVINEQSI